MGYSFYYPPENKIVVERYADFLEKDFILQKESGRIVELEDQYILPSENTSEHPIKEESLALIVSQKEDVIPVLKEHSVRDLNKPANYKAALSVSEFDKWLVAMNAEMQSMYDNKVWRLVVLPPNENLLRIREAAFILGIKIYRDRSRQLIGLSQNAYLDKIIKRYRMDNSKCGSIPMQVDLYLSKSQCATTSAEMKRMQNFPYASAIGSIMYVVRCTRHDVAFAQNITRRFQQNSGEAHWTVVKNIFKYLRNTKDAFLVYGGDPETELRVNCYCDAGFETDRDDTKSQTGYVYVLNGGAVDEDILPYENTREHPIEEENLALIVYQEEDVILVRRSVRTHKAPDRLCLNVEIDPDRQCFNVEVEEHSLGDLNEPTNYKAALSDPEFEKWLVAMNAEMQSMCDNKVWRFVVLPPNAKVVKIKWIYKKKMDTDGKVHIYKARLVAKCCTQTYGVDYEEKILPVADIRAIRILIAIAAYYDYEIWQMDVKTVFLNGFLEEEIYMEQPDGFIDPNHPRKVCNLQRSIYRLKQASRSWNKRFDEEIKKFGEAAFIIGIKIYRDKSRLLIGLSQIAYLDKILKRYRMDNSKRGSIPLQVDLHLSKSQCATTSTEMKRMYNVPYASAVGSIISKQSITTQHATKAEYIAASEAAKEVVWIRKFIDELGIVLSNDYPTEMNCDNSTAIIMAKESGIQKGARHFKRKYHYVREYIETDKFDIVKVHTDDNLADSFTKALAGPKLT
nr:hypothetical protein [Tanacetum cinerariifolium]